MVLPINLGLESHDRWRISLFWWSKLNWTNRREIHYIELIVERYNCSNDHLYKTTTRLRRPMLGPPNQIPIQPLMYKTTTCLTRPTTSFFCFTNEKNLSKTTTTKLYPAKKWETNIRQQCIKNKCLSDIYSIATS